MLGFDIETKTLSSDALTPLSTANIVAGEGASADDFSFITYGSSPDIAEEDILFFYKGSQVITVTHNTGSAPSNSGNIQLLNGASKVLNTNLPLILQRKGNVFYEIISSAGTTVTAASTTTFTNKSIDLTDNTLTGSSAELATAISDETGSGALVFGTSPTFVTPVLGQPASGNLTDCTFPTLNQSTTGSSASCTGNSVTATTATNATNVALTNEASDTTCFPVFVDTATGNQDAKTNASLTFNASNATLSATTFSGALTGNASGTSATVTGATQAAITSCANLVTVGTIATGTWNATAVDVAYLASNAKTQAIMFAVSDESTALTTGTGKLTFRMPYAMTLFAGVLGIKASLTTAGSTSGVTTVDVNEGGSTILSTKLTIDSTEKTSTTAATPPVISDTALAADAEITVDIDGLSGGATEAGLKITLIGIPA
jgi:hypothetical protein